ncbi:MAG TPA: histone deacetylase [Methanomicrobia archaeon]|nr:histone deacetylase [Methanomicrobia archaeon]HEX59834.1 histone deacetylase [Methanomicrobia archaeon]
MMRTGVFFHEIFAKHSWPVMGSKFKNFPQAMAAELKLEGVRLYVPEKVSEELLLKVHTPRFVEDVKRAWYYEGAALSVGGCVKAAELVYFGELDNALVFDVAAGHHASPDHAWGGTYISCTGPAVVNLRERTGKRLRFAIIDTDSHHGDGTRNVFLGDRDVLHVCFCSSSKIEDESTKIDVDVGWKTTDEEYLRKVEREFVPRVKEFKPDLIFHILGHDTCQGDYGDRGLTKDFFPKLVALVKACAQEVCGGKYVVITHGGARADIAEYIFPRIIRVLHEDS